MLHILATAPESSRMIGGESSTYLAHSVLCAFTSHILVRNTISRRVGAGPSASIYMGKGYQHEQQDWAEKGGKQCAHLGRAPNTGRAIV